MALSVSLALCVQGCGERPDAAAEQEPMKLRVVYIPYLSFAPLRIAQEEGYYAEQNLDVEFVNLTRTVHGVPLLAQGKVDVLGGVINSGLLNSIARGANVRMVADKGHVTRGPDAYMAILVGNQMVEQGVLSDPSLLRGKTVLHTEDNLGSYLIELGMQKLGLNPEDVETSFASSASRFGAAEQGAMDLALMIEPWLTRTVDAGYGRPLVSDFEVMPDYQVACIWFGPSLLEENPEAGRRFMVAYLKAVRQYGLGKTERNLAIISASTGLEPDLLSRAHWVPCHADGSINVESVMDFQAWAERKGFVDRTLSPEEFWDPSFAQYACGVLDGTNGEVE